jgi:hypothetical protein
MKRPKSVALVGGGKLSSSSLAGFWLHSEMLGPVMASSYRLASRIANSFRAGHPVRNYAGFDACKLILICVPDPALPAVIADLCSSNISWSGKSVVLWSAWLGSGELIELSRRGASVGSIATIPGFQDQWYLIEGDKRAIQESTRLVENRERRSVAIERGLKPLYLAALTCTGSLLFPLVMAASESLRLAGVPSPVAAKMLEMQLNGSLRSYARGGKRAYAPPRELTDQLLALSVADPKLAHYVEQSSRLAEQLMERSRPIRLRNLARTTTAAGAVGPSHADEQIVLAR